MNAIEGNLNIMEQYLFVCIGTNKLIVDSFGPRVGEILERNFLPFSHLQVLGTMKSPIHFENAHLFLEKMDKTKQHKIIAIDSAFGRNEKVGETYFHFGGIEIGKAFGKSFYFPANLTIKTVVGNLEEEQKHVDTYQINQLAYEIAEKITKAVLAF